MSLNSAVQRFPSAVRKLQKYGHNALIPTKNLPTVTTTSSSTLADNNSDNHVEGAASVTLVPTTNLQSILSLWREEHKEPRTEWNKPMLSKRKTNVLRKQAMVQNVYGTFDVETGIGWDKQWDIEMTISQKYRSSNMGRIRINVPKGTKRVRTREDRAQKIDQNMIGMKDRIVQEIYVERQKQKILPTFENKYKEMMKVK